MLVKTDESGAQRKWLRASPRYTDAMFAAIKIDKKAHGPISWTITWKTFRCRIISHLRYIYSVFATLRNLYGEDPP